MLKRIALMSLMVLALALPTALAQGPADPGKGMPGCPLHGADGPGKCCKMHGEGCCKMMGGQGCCKMHGEADCKMHPGQGACGKDGGMGPCPMMGALNTFLGAGLSDKQVADLLQLQADTGKKQYPLLRKKQEVESQLDGVRSAEKPDVGKMKDLMVEMAKVVADLEGNKMTVHEKVMGMLTPEQREKLEAHGMPLAGGPGKCCGMGHGEGPGPGPMGKHPCGMMEPKKAE